MSDDVTIQTSGTLQIIAAFQALPEKSRRRVIRPAVRKAGGKISKAMKRAVKSTRKAAHRDKGTGRKTAGLFEKSIGVKVVTYKARELVMAIVGSRRGSQFEGRANLGHLIEFGWRIARGGTLSRESGAKTAKSRLSGGRGGGVSVGRVPGRHVAERALKSTESEVKSTLETEVAKGIEKQAASLNRAH